MSDTVAAARPHRDPGVRTTAFGYPRAVPPIAPPAPARAHRLPSVAVGRIAGPPIELFAHRPMGTQD
jgi:hypothetical protein